MPFKPKLMMMTVRSLLTLVLTMYFFVARTQTIKLVKSNNMLRPYISKTDTLVPNQVKVVLELSGNKPAKDVEVPLKLVTLRPSALQPKVIPAQITLTPADWPESGSSEKRVEKTIYLEMKSATSFPNEEAFNIVLGDVKGATVTAGEENNINIRVSSVGVYDFNKPFWVEIGANFDLVDGLQPNNFFSGVFFHKRDIRPFRKNQPNNIGVFAGIYESKSVTQETERNFALQRFYDSSSFIPNVADSMTIYRGIGHFVNKRVVRNIGLFFSPQFRLSRSSANENGLHFFTSVWFDLQWQRIEEESSFSLFRKQDSFRVNINDISTYNTSNYKRETDVRSHYFGIGFPIYFREATTEADVVQLFVNPVVGATNQPSKSFLDSKGELFSTVRAWRPFYIVQFRLNEEKYGISFTGEVRGLISDNNPPVISLALSKKFDLTKFIEFAK